MSKKKIAIAVLVLLLLAVASVFGMLYVTSGLLVKYLSLGDVTPHLSLPFELAKFGAKKEKVFGVIALCLLITAEVFLRWGARITPTDALWNLVPAVLWSVGMLIARRHPLDRTSVGTGLATLLPHVYQTILADFQLLSVTAAALLVGATFFVAVRRESDTQP